MQVTLETALTAVTGEAIRLFGSGRTDAGAHACRQVTCFDTASRHSPAVLQRAANAHLPADIAVVESSQVDGSFHPRYDATSRIYRYLIWNRPVRSPFWNGRAAHIPYPLDVTAMSLAAQHLVGRHDYGAFVPAAESRSRLRTTYQSEVSRQGDLIAIELEAEGFLRQMVRSVAGTLVEVGTGALTVEEFGDVVRSADRRKGGRTLPAYGLYLVDVKYEHPDNRIQNGAAGDGVPIAAEDQEKT